MLGQPPLPLRGVLAQHPTGDPQRALAPTRVPGRVAGRQERLDRVHVGVESAVGVEGGEPLVPGIDDHAVLLRPEPLLEAVERVLQEGRCGGVSGDEGARGGQDHERVAVRLLDPDARAVAVTRGIPPPMVAVLEPA